MKQENKVILESTPYSNDGYPFQLAWLQSQIKSLKQQLEEIEDIVECAINTNSHEYYDPDEVLVKIQYAYEEYQDKHYGVIEESIKEKPTKSRAAKTLRRKRNK